MRLCNVQDRLGGISLHECIIGERVDVAQWLLDRRVKVDVTDWDGFSPLSMAMNSSAQLHSKVCRLVSAHALKPAQHERRKQCSKCGKSQRPSSWVLALHGALRSRDPSV